MTAAELYEMVKDLPPEASPHCYGSAYEGKNVVWFYYTSDGIKYAVDVEAVVLGYEASMTRYLLNKYAMQLEQDGDDVFRVFLGWFGFRYEHEILVIALAKAVRAVSEE